MDKIGRRTCDLAEMSGYRPTDMGYSFNDGWNAKAWSVKHGAELLSMRRRQSLRRHSMANSDLQMTAARAAACNNRRAAHPSNPRT
eukprot:4972935-Lingulodinium_polyedra.AAC.1